MTSPSEIVKRLEPARFSEILSASPKRFREDLFRRAGVRVKTGAFSLASSSKGQLKTEKLLDAMREGAEIGDDVLEEAIRNYLYTRRQMLADALDHFQIPHENGLTDHDLDFIGKLPPDKVEALKKALEAKYTPEDVALYLAFMNFPGA